MTGMSGSHWRAQFRVITNPVVTLGDVAKPPEQ